nr:hypothetical protein [Tanacetum cinerariifolium]
LFSFGVDAVEDFKEYTLRDYYCWLKTYCCWYKLKLLDNAIDSRLRLLEQSAAVDDKMKKSTYCCWSIYLRLLVLVTTVSTNS